MQEVTTIHEEKHITHPVKRVVPVHYENIAHGLRAPSVSLCGYLRKKSPSGFHKWQKRYFVFIIEEQALLYYKHRADAEADHHRRGNILIREIHSVESVGEYEFHITTPHRVYELEAPVRYAKNVWVDSLRLIREIVTDCRTKHLDQCGMNKAIEDGLRNLSFQEGAAIEETHHAHDPHDVTTIDVHGHEHHGRIVEQPSRSHAVVHEHADAVEVIRGEEIVTKKNEITQRGNLVVEKEEVIVERSDLPHSTVINQAPVVVEQTITTVQEPIDTCIDATRYYASSAELAAVSTGIKEFQIIESGPMQTLPSQFVESTTVTTIPEPVIRQEVVTTETVTTNPVYQHDHHHEHHHHHHEQHHHEHMTSGYYGEAHTGFMDKGVSLANEMPIAQDVHIEKTTEIKTNPVLPGFTQPTLY